MLSTQTPKKVPITLIYFVVTWLIVEIVLVIAPFIIPDTWYLNAYLSQTAKDKTTEFLNGQNATIPNKELGWENKKNLSLGPWVIDQWGGRHHKPVSLEKPAQTYRTIILGSSLMNGNNAVDNNGTISAFLDTQLNQDIDTLLPQYSNKKHEVLNFATMMYGMDQILIQIKHAIMKFNPDMIIIGLHEEPVDSLKNVYIPFRLPEEENMPYVKPHFELQNDELTFHEAPLHLLSPINHNSVQYFKDHDAFYFNFARFEHFGLMPIANELSKVYLKARNMLSYWSAQQEEYTLLRTLMANLQSYADTKGIEIIYVYLPTPRSLDQGGLWKYIPDYYAQRLSWLQAPWHSDEIKHLATAPQTTKPQVLDIRHYFRQSTISTDELYDADYFHFSKVGNQTISKAIEQSVFLKN